MIQGPGRKKAIIGLRINVKWIKVHLYMDKGLSPYEEKVQVFSYLIRICGKKFQPLFYYISFYGSMKMFYKWGSLVESRFFSKSIKIENLKTLRIQVYLR